MKTFNFTISHALAVAIVNDDPSGLSDTDINAIESWYEKYNIGWVTIPDDAELLEGTQCEITKLWGDCIDVIAYESVRYDMTPCKTSYSIEYDTEYGTASFAGEYGDCETFIAEANKAGREAGVLGSHESVLDCDYHIEVD